MTIATIELGIASFLLQIVWRLDGVRADRSSKETEKGRPKYGSFHISSRPSLKDLDEKDK